ncbi:putative S12 family peptidase [Rhodococcus opacus B4]|uniref:Putative S12 family peptidase n=1 Tax=Rhodococcus opacus (strain B4) TaxID=632772 RepID=C1AR95_RHOOB|nr:putative S12 family peptidase [Rhodococcus opacus B4]
MGSRARIRKRSASWCRPSARCSNHGAEAVMATMRDSPAEYVRDRRTGVDRFRTLRATRIAVLAACGALVIAGCSPTSEPTTSENGSLPAATSATGTAASGSALNSIDPAAFQAAVDAAAEELMMPGAVVQLRTPQGNVDAVVGTPRNWERTHRRMRRPVSGSRRTPKP